MKNVIYSEKREAVFAFIKPGGGELLMEGAIAVAEG